LVILFYLVLFYLITRHEKAFKFLYIYIIIHFELAR